MFEVVTPSYLYLSSKEKKLTTNCTISYSAMNYTEFMSLLETADILWTVTLYQRLSLKKKRG